MTQSLYERIGGAPAVEAAVGIFYDKIMADPALRPFFEGIDMKKQARHQINFMTYAFGGPNQYTGRSLKASHAKLVSEKGLSDKHFDKVAGHLKATLEQLNVPAGLVNEVITLVASTREDVLGRSSAA